MLIPNLFLNRIRKRERSQLLERRSGVEVMMSMIRIKRSMTKIRLKNNKTETNIIRIMYILFKSLDRLMFLKILVPEEMLRFQVDQNHMLSFN